MPTKYLEIGILIVQHHLVNHLQRLKNRLVFRLILNFEYYCTDFLKLQEDSDEEWEDNAKWMSPPNFFKYWCSRNEKFLEAKEDFDTQHIMLNKTKDEYNDWKRKHEENLQRAIKNHPIAAVFLNLNKKM